MLDRNFAVGLAFPIGYNYLPGYGLQQAWASGRLGVTEKKRDCSRKDCAVAQRTSLRWPTLSQERERKKKSACSVRNGGDSLRVESGCFLEFEFGGVAEGVEDAERG